MRIALVAGEISGDILGAGLIRALRERYPQAEFYGVAGPRMVEAGCRAIESIEALSVMGLAEVLSELPRLLRLRASLLERIAADRPACVIGIDAPDFNLGLERRLKALGIPTVHVVSPTVWAWRAGRVKSIARSVDLMLCLYPFEPAFYAGKGVAARYIGHPLADELANPPGQRAARAQLGLAPDVPVVGVLPGSRNSEIRFLAEPFVRAAAWLAARHPQLHFVTPLAKPGLRAGFEAALREHAPGLRWSLVDGQSREAMLAADVVLLASGTATLECLLLGRPMVVGYRTASLTAWVMLDLGLFKGRYFSLPNILTASPTVPELLQAGCTPERLGAEVACLLGSAWPRERQLAQFDLVRAELKRDAARQAAGAIADLLAAPPVAAVSS